jgi:hypothetical protein
VKINDHKDPLYRFPQIILQECLLPIGNKKKSYPSVDDIIMLKTPKILFPKAYRIPEGIANYLNKFFSEIAEWEKRISF